MSQVVLVVDDDPVQRRLVEAMVQRFGYEVLTADSGDAALTLLTGGNPIDAVVLDLVMPDLDGLGVLARLRDAGIGTPVIVQTAHGGIDNVVSAMRAGAADFVVKPVGPERLQVSLRNALAAKALAGELQRIKRKQEGTLTIDDVISRSPAMQSVLRAVEKAAASVIPVLIEGESGVGKELIARAIHGSGGRRAKPFIAVNCGALPETLVESILFGHEKGAFTGATEKHTGKFIEADGGTLFLDEVGELPLPAQVKLLRALQEGEVEPVGGRKSVKVDVRIVSATNRDLIADVKASRFREDLFYRLHVFPVNVPPLRRRPEDVPELTRHFLTRIAAEEGKRVRAITGEALALLSRYRWPGNVRQLENTVFRAVVLADGEEIGVSEFPQIAAQIDDDNATPVQPALEPVTALIDPWVAREASLAPAERHSLAGMGPTLRLTDTRGEVRPLEDIESEVIRFALSHYRGQMSEVARRLKIGRSTLYRKLEELELDGKEAPIKVNGAIGAP
ncbi:sigma-54-dependent Fis family transcriptional regulator [Pseudolabrys taiwanensis]|uniref:DNA-binding transcriptional regulator NtrC n=1 Tax=Pseudolabrys taiwanensis TaxID=331696 RepID=A0A346A1Y1_9HYPH|nr:sigma-54 dependent transcriptional regulator [Pseudolabrys taiwanensis]AXK83178.1 sigma-54-dependent Fis family transcriptional regulator [Pseudolabrys taiwanensis]